MKTSFVLLIAGALSCLAAPCRATAQGYATDRGSLILGGSGGLTRTTYTGVDNGRTVDLHNTYAHLSPTVQYFVAPGLALGGTINVVRFSQGDNSSTSYGAGPIASYFFGKGEQTLRPYVSASTTLSASGDFSGTGGRETGYGWGASAGSLYMLSRAVALDVGAFYRRRGGGGSDAQASYLGVSLGFSAFTF